MERYLLIYSFLLIATICLIGCSDKAKWANALRAFSQGVNQHSSQTQNSYITNSNNQSNFMCQQSIANRDSGGIDTFCNDMDFMLRESIKQNNSGAIDTFGNELDFMCREAIKSGDRGQIMIYCD